MTVDHYALRSDNQTDYELRNWELQGSQEAGGPWTTLRRHDNDRSLDSREHFVAAWPVEPAGPFRFFRIYQHGKNQGADNSEHCHHIRCAGIELYGALVEE